MTVILERKGTTFAVNRTGENEYRFSVNQPSARGVTHTLTRGCLEELIRGLISIFEGKSEESDEERPELILNVLKKYAADTKTTLEKVDRQISDTQIVVGGKKRAMTREEWLAEKLGPTLEEVLAGKLSLAEAIDAAETSDIEELASAGTDESDPDAGDSVRA